MYMASVKIRCNQIEGVLEVLIVDLKIVKFIYNETLYNFVKEQKENMIIL